MDELSPPAVTGALVGLAAGEAGGDPDGRASGHLVLAVVVGYHLLEEGGIDAPSLGRAIARVAADTDGAGLLVPERVGKRMPAFVDHLLDGADVYSSAQPDAGPGPAARVAPVGIHGGDDAALVAAAIESALVTHADPPAAAGAVAVAAAIRCAAAGAVGADLLAACAAVASDAEHLVFEEYFDRLRPGEHWHAVSRAVDAAAARAPAAGDVPALIDLAERLAGGRFGPPGEAPVVVATALAAAAAWDPSNPAGVVAAARRAAGSDADPATIGAITGAVTGARLGSGAMGLLRGEAAGSLGRRPVEALLALGAALTGDAPMPAPLPPRDLLIEAIRSGD